MNMVGIIEKKRDGKRLSSDEINFFVENYTAGKIPDYQASALLMAIYFQKMDWEETFYLTRAITETGDIIDLSDIHGIKVDKHSTGGVGDKTTLIVAPLAAACGVPIAKMSGRGLGFTGGTVDKLESIPGFQTELSSYEFKSMVNEVGIAIIGQSTQIAKGDKLLYALRDVTATMDNVSLIASSIMSKKLAAGCDAILLDVKCGSGAFMNTEEEALELSRLMVEIGINGGKDTVAAITDMSQPLGRSIGNALEVIEAIEVLKGKGPADIRELSLTLSGLMIYLGKKADTPEEGKEKATKALNNGSGIEIFRKFVQGQRGNPQVVDDYSLFPQAEYKIDGICSKGGYVSSIETDILGKTSQCIGAGRTVKDAPLDLSAGLMLEKKVGDKVAVGDRLFTLHGNNPAKMEECIEECTSAFRIGNESTDPLPIVKEFVGLNRLKKG